MKNFACPLALGLSLLASVGCKNGGDDALWMRDQDQDEIKAVARIKYLMEHEASADPLKITYVDPQDAVVEIQEVKTYVQDERCALLGTIGLVPCVTNETTEVQYVVRLSVQGRQLTSVPRVEFAGANQTKEEWDREVNNAISSGALLRVIGADLNGHAMPEALKQVSVSMHQISDADVTLFDAESLWRQERTLLPVQCFDELFLEGVKPEGAERNTMLVVERAGEPAVKLRLKYGESSDPVQLENKRSVFTIKAYESVNNGDDGLISGSIVWSRKDFPDYLQLVHPASNQFGYGVHQSQQLTSNLEDIQIKAHLMWYCLPDYSKEALLEAGLIAE